MGRITQAAALAACLAAAPVLAQSQTYYFGADLSFANEMLDCGAVFKQGGTVYDPYALMKGHGANLIRIRIWNDATWTEYSNLADVKRSIARTRALGMQVLLDFHYSDDWADGDKQIIPKAWENIADTDALARAMYQYTYDVLVALDRDGLMPEMVQVGNETNGEILGRADWKGRPINWDRNAKLLNAGIRAVRDAGAKSTIRPLVMLHIAQPENIEPWFEAAATAGVTDFDLIGLSYYKKWSKQSIAEMGATVRRLDARYAQGIILVETAYPWTLGWADSSGNVLGEDSLIAGYPATPAGQKQYLIDVTQTVISNGGLGTVYWAPDWVSTQCSTRWGKGSAWENATFFDNKGEVLPGIDFMRHKYEKPASAN
jgi:arabinogalactan endo-1,4-beta-galactosidase